MHRTTLPLTLFLLAGCSDGRETSNPGGGGPGSGGGWTEVGSAGSDGDGDSGGGGDSGSSASGGGDNRFDVGEGTEDGGPGDCPGGGQTGETTEFSLIWIANSPEGTVSKIDTRTGVELARYRTGDGVPDPSRTAVNLEGDVAVANRGGGLVKFASNEQRCIDRNGNGVIDTSSGPGDVLPFGQDECLLWSVGLPGGGGLPTNHQGPRPLGWDSGASNSPCSAADDRVWVGYYEHAANRGVFRRYMGTTGDLDATVEVPGWDATDVKNWGPYGGAVDSAGNFWVIGWTGPLVRIDADTLTAQKWEVPPGTAPYGIALDADGHPWLAGLLGHVLTFDPATERFEIAVGQLPGDPLTNANGAVRSLRGLMIDREGQAWVAANHPCGVLQIDTARRELVADVRPGGCASPVGVSIDVDGHVWVPDQAANLAFKIDPVNHTASITDGLNAPYTYSDMTGAGLGLVVFPPQG